MGVLYIKASIRALFGHGAATADRLGILPRHVSEKTKDSTKCVSPSLSLSDSLSQTLSLSVLSHEWIVEFLCIGLRVLYPRLVSITHNHIATQSLVSEQVRSKGSGSLLAPCARWARRSYGSGAPSLHFQETGFSAHVCLCFGGPRTRMFSFASRWFWW